MPVVRQKLGAACKGAAVEQGIAGATPGSRPSFIAMGHLYFESAEAFQGVLPTIGSHLSTTFNTTSIPKFWRPG